MNPITGLKILSNPLENRPTHPSFLLVLWASTKVTSPAFLIRSFRSCFKAHVKILVTNYQMCDVSREPFQTWSGRNKQAIWNQHSHLLLGLSNTDFQQQNHIKYMSSSRFSGGRVSEEDPLKRLHDNRQALLYPMEEYPKNPINWFLEYAFVFRLTGKDILTFKWDAK